MSTKNPVVVGKDFYVFKEIFEEDKGVFIKFFQPTEVKLSTIEGHVSEVEICISKEVWQEFVSKIKDVQENLTTII